LQELALQQFCLRQQPKPNQATVSLPSLDHAGAGAKFITHLSALQYPIGAAFDIPEMFCVGEIQRPGIQLGRLKPLK
jgi:hypothetical protein